MSDDGIMIRQALETQLRNKMYSVASTVDLKGARKILASDSSENELACLPKERIARGSKQFLSTKNEKHF